MRARMLSGLVLMLAATTVAAESFGLDSLMNGLQQRRGGEVSYTETKHLSTLKTPLVSEGLLRFRHPDYLEKEVRNRMLSLVSTSSWQTRFVSSSYCFR